MNNSSIEQVPSASLPPVVQPNNGNFQLMSGGFEVQIILAFATLITPATPFGIKCLEIRAKQPRKNKR